MDAANEAWKKDPDRLATAILTRGQWDEIRAAIEAYASQVLAGDTATQFRLLGSSIGLQID